MDKLFVAYKPMFVSSNQYLSQLKKQYRVKKAGFSGTLDPFAKGCLIVAFGKYTKLFRFLQKTPKLYQATLFLGAKSDTLDIEQITQVNIVIIFDIATIQSTLEKFLGKITQLPPKYSAKKINGIRAYNLARQNKEVQLQPIEIEVFDIKLINYTHPFLTLQFSVSEGSYIRSLARDIAEDLGVDMALTSLERLQEGKFVFDNHKSLNPLEYLTISQNYYLADSQNLRLGKKLQKHDFKYQEHGIYFVVYDEFFAIIQIDNEVKYLLNQVKL
ncbi:MAG: tRNA pseudouridine(55) synthase TruB [Epsilonproteobacteria bacterium]|nr:tRNA pseudouridine(55) synthase TruB [Campylobacterota bacterium]